MKHFVYPAALASAAFLMVACGNPPADTSKPLPAGIHEEMVSYQTDSVQMSGFIAYPEDSSDVKKPAILVVPEWWGLNDYVKKRAGDLARLGYIAMAVDMYGNGKVASTAEEAGALAGPFYANPRMAKQRFDAALQKVKEFPGTDTTRIAAIGYCFGGGMVLNMAKMGENLKGVVSFHGTLNGVPADKDLLKAQILVCHGAIDQFVKPEEVAAFRKQLDSIGAAYTFKEYANAGHAFTNPDATENGRKFNLPLAYNAAADTASWADMKIFLNNIFEPVGETLK